MFKRHARLNVIQGSDGAGIPPLLSCFTVGSTVRCKICFDEEVLGEVVAFDAGTKLLMLKVPTKKRGSGGRMLCDMNIVNLNFCIDLEIVKEVVLSKNMQTPAALSLQKLQKRLNDVTVQRAKYLKCFHPKVLPIGQALYRQIANHLGDHQVSWLEQDKIVSIFVLQQVIIEPPYGVANVRSQQEAPKLVLYVQRIVQQFLNNQN
ncbi:protein Hezron [Drosophila obscura]|uniref:protein Hezron n=1 Tax=Drosophila obscura TaxID=7282 RepID=UPI000BA013AD|nr:protein Hezron [Drosophila obscura]